MGIDAGPTGRRQLRWGVSGAAPHDRCAGVVAGQRVDNPGRARTAPGRSGLLAGLHEEHSLPAAVARTGDAHRLTARTQRRGRSPRGGEGRPGDRIAGCLVCCLVQSFGHVIERISTNGVLRRLLESVHGESGP